MENWKDIPNYKGHYQASDLGRIKSIKFKKEVILKPSITSNGYKKVTLSIYGKLYYKSVHQLVAMAFLNHKIKGYSMVIDHINDIKTDNTLSNLRIVTQRENTTKGAVKQNRSSKYIGVHLFKESNKWIASMYIDGKTKHLGIFKTEIEASEAYQNKLKEIKNPSRL